MPPPGRGGAGQAAGRRTGARGANAGRRWAGGGEHAVGPAVTVLAGIAGLAVGSFLNTFIDRWPREEPVTFPPSRCEHCGRRLRPLEMVPVASWIVLRGRCRTCGGAIGWQAPLVESVTGLLFAAVAAAAGTPAQLLLGLGFVAVLVAVTGVDLRCQLIPNVALLAGLGWAALVVLALVVPGPWAGWLAAPVAPASLEGAGAGAFAVPGPDEPAPASAATPSAPLIRPPAVAPGWASWARALGAAAVGGLIFQILRWGSRGGLGFGDVKLAAWLGFYLGPRALPVALFTAAILGGLVAAVLLLTGRRGRRDVIPFGPFLAAGGLVGWFFGEGLWQAYLGLGTG